MKTILGGLVKMDVRLYRFLVILYLSVVLLISFVGIASIDTDSLSTLNYWILMLLKTIVILTLISLVLKQIDNIKEDE